MTMAYIAVAAIVVGGGLSAAGAIKQANTAEATAQFEADQMEVNATQARSQANAAEDAKREEARKIIGSQMAAQSQSGAQLNGSAADLLKQSLFNAEADAQSIRYQGENEARGLSNRAAGTLVEGRLRKEAGYLSAAGSLVSTAGSAYGAYKKIG